MKKGIKYAGIAAATLLTVAPVVAPVVGSTTQTVQAAELTAAQKAAKALKNVSSSFESEYKLNKTEFGDLELTGDGFQALYQKGNVKFAKLKDLAAFTKLLKQDGKDFNTDTTANLNNVRFYIEGSTPTRSIDNSEDFQRLATDAQTNGGTVKLTITAYKAQTDQTGEEAGKTFYNLGDLKSDQILGKKTITITSTGKEAAADPAEKTATISYTNPYNVDVDSNVVNAQLVASTDTKAQFKGKDVNASTAVGKKIYKTKDVATKIATQAFGDDDPKAINDQYNGSKFTNDDTTYYQVLTIAITDKDDSTKTLDLKQVNTDAVNSGEGFVKVNGETLAADQFGQKTDDTKKNEVRVVREIHVGKKAPEWKEEAVKGQVHVGDKLVGLVMTDGKAGSRSLEKNTDWLTDKKRTNKDGVVQYHVSTDEWVDANDVKFTADSAVTTPSTGELTDIQDLQGRHVVSLDGPAGFVYSLFTAEGKLASRGLAGLTSWATDKTAKDAEGTVYYRVSTNEWIKAGNGVNFK